MNTKILTPFIVAFVFYTAQAQISPVGTIYHIARFSSYSDTANQRYSAYTVTEKVIENKTYQEFGSGFNQVRFDANRLFGYYPDANGVYKERLLFDFNSKVGDSIELDCNIAFSTNFELPYFNQRIKVLISAISFEHFIDENNKLDSLKSFSYHGVTKLYDPFIEDSITKEYSGFVIEKILVTETNVRRYWLRANLGPYVTAELYQRVRCIEFPDGRVWKMKWWYDIVGNNFPCDYKFYLNTQEQDGLASPLVVYPNPAYHELHLKDYEGHVDIYDILGKLLLSNDVSPLSPINVSNLPNGSYVLQIRGKNEQRIPFTIIH